MTNTEPRPTVVLADDHLGTLNAVSRVIGEEFEILSAVSDGTRALEAVALFKPDVVVLDIAMPGKDGFEAARLIRDLRLSTKIVFLTITEDWDYVRTAAALGASYVLKRRMHHDLVKAANQALAGQLFVSPMTTVEVPSGGKR